MKRFNRKIRISCSAGNGNIKYIKLKGYERKPGGKEVLQVSDFAPDAIHVGNKRGTDKHFLKYQRQIRGSLLTAVRLLSEKWSSEFV